MEEEKQKKKKLTLSVSSKTNRNVTSFAKRSGKPSVVIEKNLQENGVKENFNQEIILILVIFQKNHQYVKM